MRIQERCFLRAFAGLCLLGGVALFSSALDLEPLEQTTVAGIDVTEVPSVQPLPAEGKDESNDRKFEYPTKDQDSKTTLEPKKKPVADFKIKTDLKYQKPVKDDDSKREEVESGATTSWMSSTKSIDDTTTTTSSMETMGITVPFLFRGEPIVPTTITSNVSSMIDSSMSGNKNRTGEMHTTEATTAFRGRALNISAPEPANSLHSNITDLSDVSMDDDDKEVEGGEYVASHNETTMNISSTLLPAMLCVDGNRTYSLGEKIVRGCEEKCVCGEGGVAMDCKPLCSSPYVRANRGIEDPLCQEKLVNEEPCCAILVCAADSAPEPEETCVFENKTIMRGQRVEDGCSRVCVCEVGGNLKCQPRCPPNETTSATNQHDRCVVLADPRDSCCTITLCDVTLGDHEIRPEISTDLTVNLTDAKVLNSTAIKLKLSTKNPQDVTVEISDKNHVWRQQRPDKDGVISNLEPAHTYYVRVIEGSRTGPALQVFLPAEVIKTNISEKIGDKNSCSHRGKIYKVGAEWYDECISFCMCAEGGKTECVTIECPTDFGLDVLDPHCLDWETVPSDFVSKPPHCCPQEVRCRNNGSCNYEGKTYDNWSELPTNVTGCEKRCYCEMGNVSCQAACPPVPALPPANLPCPSYQAALAHLPGDECCMEWSCNHPSSQLPGTNATPAFPGPLATDTFDRRPIDDSKRPNNKSGSAGPSQQPGRATSSLREDSTDVNANTDITTTHGLFHYPMDPGHPTVPYNGPYSPDYKPTRPSVEDVFHLNPHAPEKPLTPVKEKAKSKTDAKKPVELIAKPHKDDYFPGPLAPDKFLDKTVSIPVHPNENTQHILGPVNPNKLPSPPKAGHATDQPQFVPLNPHQNAGPGFPFVPTNGQNIPQSSFNPQLDNTQAGPPYRGPILGPDSVDPNVIIPLNPKKKIPASDAFDGEKIKSPTGLPGRPKQGQRDPEQEILPEELYHLINLQHPGLVHLDHGPPEGHSGLYDIHQQISNQKQSTTNQIQPGYFGGSAAGPKKPSKPHVYAQKNENGQTTYHVHTPDIPSTPQQIEELLAHISQHDPNPGPFQHFPGQPAIPHNGPSGPQATLPLHIDAHIPHSGLTHLNHPFAAQTPNQSGMDHNVPPGFPLPGAIPGFPIGSSSEEVTVQILEALDENTVRLIFTVPQVLVGLHGRVELRYTNDKTNFDVSTWKAQVFAPPNDLIATPQLEFELGDLKPSTDYKVKITVKLKDLANSPTSKIYSVRTLEKRAEITTLPPQIPIDAELQVTETNSTWINVMWKKFTEYELQFIDGVQLRYKEQDGKVYSGTPLIHRAVTNYMIENLKPSTMYEVGIFFVPFPGQLTELISEKTIHVTTSMEPDPYSFDVRVEIKTIKSTDVEVTWSGVPYPEDKYVNIYRAIYQSDSGKEDTSTFKIAKRDSHAKTVISDLKPGTRYRLWLEVYLTNGRIKKSNVQDFVTKAGVLPATISQQAGKLASIPLHEGDYYGPLVVVAIVASLAILSTLILLMMLMKRRTSSKADISPRKTTSAYDNPSYKTCEDAVTISNGRNKNTEHEMTTMNTNVKESV
ncbi:PREDICTED: putative epidermal cell surface receptor [Dufourea novaeangliae]|uniref:Putative epidermal cell surface receptor n=1 Tax=Dufourea novaeangliae TaxID=178035 RepID=A0A154P3E1_DUFNO|nr:PREDICTED: putative epidermal cell surface receptor [Dufourea novaeangliae]KZC06455.1 Putative epidermal cell surface receptor [Dufourea novaeangliae]